MFCGLSILAFFILNGNKDIEDNKTVVGEDETTSEDIATDDIATSTKDEIIDNTINYIPLTDEEIDDIMAAGVNWLKRSQEDSGHFLYEYSPLSDAYSKADLMVRQTGALYILGEFLRRDKENKYELKDTVINALSYFENNSREGEFNGYQFRCIQRIENVCSLGAVSLGLVGILDLIEANPELEKEHQKLLDDYLHYLLAMKKPDEGFRGFYYLTGNVQSEKESHFSNGEALLALARYYKYNPTDEVKTVIDASFDYFNSQYSEGSWDYNFYLWGMAALKDLYQLEPKQEYYDFVKDYTDWRISGYKKQRNSLGNKCAYIEGVISAYSVIESKLTEKEKEYYLEEIDYWLFKSEELQVGGSGSIPFKVGDETHKLKVLYPYKAQGGFLTGLNKFQQRIDFTQHCLSCYLQTQTDIKNREL